MATLSSLASMAPEPSVSKRSNASLSTKRALSTSVWLGPSTSCGPQACLNSWRTDTHQRETLGEQTKEQEASRTAIDLRSESAPDLLLLLLRLGKRVWYTEHPTAVDEPWSAPDLLLLLLCQPIWPRTRLFVPPHGGDFAIALRRKTQTCIIAL